MNQSSLSSISISSSNIINSIQNSSIAKYIHFLGTILFALLLFFTYSILFPKTTVNAFQLPLLSFQRQHNLQYLLSSSSSSSTVTKSQYISQRKLFLINTLTMISSTISETNGLMSTTITTTTTIPAVPLLLDDVIQMNTLAETATAYASANGLQVAISNKGQDNNKDNKNNIEKLFTCAPISLLPNAFPKNEFYKAIDVAPLFNTLVNTISHDTEFLQTTLGGTVSDTDPFTNKLLQLYLQIYSNDNNNNNNDSTKKPNFAKIADSLGILRSDYMLSQSDSSSSSSSTDTTTTSSYHIKQVELNTIASSFAGLASKVTQLHTYLIDRYNPTSNEIQSFLHTNQNIVTGTTSSTCTGSSTSNNDIDNTSSNNDNDIGVPYNPTMEKLPYAINIAVEQYKKRFIRSVEDTTTTTTTTNNNNIIVLFVVQPNESNTVDQRMLEFALYNNHKINVVRKSLAEIHEQVQLNPITGSLTLVSHNNNIDNDNIIESEIAVVYYRAGYAPTDYPSGIDGIEWLAREIIERSRATKCPNLGYHLAGTKKVQQTLARPGVLEKFFSSKTTINTVENAIQAQEHAQAIAKLRSTFAGLYSLDSSTMDDSDYTIVQKILSSDIERKLYVLKPQREGGGYNFYGDNLYNKLKASAAISTTATTTTNDGDVPVSLSNTITINKELGEFILMERLFPPQQHSILLRNGNIEGIGLTISELGCFGTILCSGDGQTIYHNEYSGFLLRTKFSTVDEGGVASGFATLSSLYLC